MRHSKIALSLSVLVVSIAAFFARPVHAATATSSLTVTATVAKVCVLTSGTVAFGAYDPVGANAAVPLDQSGTFTVACTRGTGYTIGLGLGNNVTGTTRRMSSGTDFLSYELYLDAGHTTVWNATNLSSGTAASITPVSLTVYGRVAAGQNVGAGSYTDTVVSTVNF
jgi:spore coat protein U-like protein